MANTRKDFRKDNPVVPIEVSIPNKVRKRFGFVKEERHRKKLIKRMTATFRRMTNLNG